MRMYFLNLGLKGLILACCIWYWKVVSMSYGRAGVLLRHEIQVSGDVSTLPSLRPNPNPKPAPTQTLGLREGRVGMSPETWIDKKYGCWLFCLTETASLHAVWQSLSKFTWDFHSSVLTDCWLIADTLAIALMVQSLLSWPPEPKAHRAMQLLPAAFSHC